jgi:Lecithin retinol acyltransferase
MTICKALEGFALCLEPTVTQRSVSYATVGPTPIDRIDPYVLLDVRAGLAIRGPWTRAFRKPASQTPPSSVEQIGSFTDGAWRRRRARFGPRSSSTVAKGNTSTTGRPSFLEAAPPGLRVELFRAAIPVARKQASAASIAAITGARGTNEQRRRTKGSIASSDEPLPDQYGELPLGAHLVTPRHGYTHHGIYVGAGRVVHYSGLAHGFRRGPVEEIPLSHFARGRPVWVRPSVAPCFDCHEIVSRARSRIGEDRYRLFTNNCEHFSQWCVYGHNRSFQASACLALPHQVLQWVADCVTRVLSPSRQHMPAGI